MTVVVAVARHFDRSIVAGPSVTGAAGVAWIMPGPERESARARDASLHDRNRLLGEHQRNRGRFEGQIEAWHGAVARGAPGSVVRARMRAEKRRGGRHARLRRDASLLCAG